MKYIYKEYKHVFDTPAKMQQETAIVNKIMDLLNKNKYDNIYEFINKNQTYQDFLKNNDLVNVVKHFGNTLNEEDFKRIQNEMVKLTEKKKDFEKENIKTTNINDKEYNSYKGENKTYFLDNSNSNMTIERQLEELQTTEEKFQTSDVKENTNAMMNELEKNKKESLNLNYLNNVNINNLNDRQKQIFNAAANYQLDNNKPIRVDLDKELIVDEEDNIMKIEKNGDSFDIISDKNNEVKTIEKEETKEPKTFQKTLIPSTNTIYSNNN